jgi:hypothetical protein
MQARLGTPLPLAGGDGGWLSQQAVMLILKALPYPNPSRIQPRRKPVCRLAFGILPATQQVTSSLYHFLNR